MTVKGEIKLVIQDGPKTGIYTLLLDFNALIALEEDFPGIMDKGAELSSLKAIRTMMYHALHAHHPDLSELDAGAIIHAAGAEPATEKLLEAMEAAFPGATKADPKAPKPARGKAGTGAGR